MSIFSAPTEFNDAGATVRPLGSWLNFRNLQIPKFAIISLVELKIVSATAGNGFYNSTFFVQITAHKDLNSEITHSEYINPADRTESCVLWQVPEPWVFEAEQNVNVTSVVQEIINLNQWSIGKKIKFFIDFRSGTGTRHSFKTAYGFSGATSPRLEVTWAAQ